MARRICVIGVGNTLMGDDGVGVRVARELASRFPDAGPGESLEIIEGQTAGMGLAPYVMGADHVIFVDAMSGTQEDPGSIFCFDPDAVGLPTLRSNTSHGVGIPYLITTSRMRGHWPDFTVFAVQVADIMCGPDTLSPDVEAVVPRVAELIAEKIAGESHS